MGMTFIPDVKKRGKVKGFRKAKISRKKNEIETERRKQNALTETEAAVQARRDVIFEYESRRALDMAEGRNHPSVYSEKETILALKGDYEKGTSIETRANPSPAVAAVVGGADGKLTGRDCPVCRADLMPLDLITALECSHKFHSRCVRPDHFGVTTCPVCSGKFFL